MPGTPAAANMQEVGLHREGRSACGIRVLRGGARDTPLRPQHARSTTAHRMKVDRARQAPVGGEAQVSSWHGGRHTGVPGRRPRGRHLCGGRSCAVRLGLLRRLGCHIEPLGLKANCIIKCVGALHWVAGGMPSRAPRARTPAVALARHAATPPAPDAAAQCRRVHPELRWAQISSRQSQAAS
jgi:hypothetical protein